MWEEVCYRKSCEGRALLCDFLSPTWQKPLMDGVKVSVRSWFLALGFSSSNIHHPPSLHPFPSPSLGNGSWRGTKRRDSSLPVKLADYTQRANCYLPAPFPYLFTFSKGPWQPWIAYLTAATLTTIPTQKIQPSFGFSTICVRGCRPVLAQVTVGAFIINMTDSGRGSCYRRWCNRKPWKAVRKSV